MHIEWDKNTVTDRRWLRVVRDLLPLLVAAIAAVAVAEQFAPLRVLDVYLAANPGVASGLGLLALNLVVVGVLLILAVHYLMGVGEENWSGQPVVQLLPVYRRGHRAGTGVPGEGADTGFKAPLYFGSPMESRFGKSGRMSPRRRRSFVLLLGAVSLAMGVLGFAFLVGPAYIRLVMIVAVMYGVGWLAWALMRVDLPSSEEAGD